MKPYKIDHVTVYSHDDIHFTLPMQPDSGKSVAKLALACIDALALDTNEMAFLYEQLDRAIDEYREAYSIPPAQQDGLTNPRLFETVTLPLGMSPPPGSKHPYYPDGIDTRMHCIDMGLNNQRTLDIYARLLGMDDRNGVEDEELCASMVDRMCSAKGEVYFFGNHNLLLGDHRHVLISPHKGWRLRFADGEQVTVPHPDYGNDVAAIAREKYARLYGEAVPRLGDGAYTQPRVSHLVVCGNDGIRFPVALSPYSVTALFTLIMRMLDAVATSKYDMAFLLWYLSRTIALTIDDRGLNTSIDIPNIRRELLLSSATSVGYQIDDMMSMPLKANSTIPYIYYMLVPLNDLSPDFVNRYKFGDNSRGMGPCVNSGRHDIRTRFKDMQKHTQVRAIFAMQTHSLGDNRSVAVVYRDGAFYYHDGEKMPLDDTMSTEDIRALILAKYHALYHA